jgi:tRNA pseudouridine38-40 synthase
LIADFNYGDLKKIGWSRATRTDKRVHALQNVFSCKVHMDKTEDEEEVRKRLNKELPEDIRVFCLLQCSNRFNAKNCTSNREYSYYLPSFMLMKITEIYFGSGKNTNQ